MARLLMMAVTKPPAVVAAGLAVWVVVLWALYRRSPRPARPDVFFGVTVAADWPDSPGGRAVDAAYQRRVKLASVAGLVLSLAGLAPPLSDAWRTLPAVAGLLVQTAAVTLAYAAGRRATLPRAMPAATVRRASLEADGSPTAGRWLLAQLGPLAVLAGSAATLAAWWPAVPARLPAHFDLAGHATRWVAKSVAAVFAMPLMGLMTWGQLTVVGWVTVHSGRRLRDAGRDDPYLRGVLWVLVAVGYLTSVLMSALSWLMVMAGSRWAAVPWGVVLGSTPAFAGVLGYFAVRRWPAIGTALAARGGDGTPDRCWRFGLFYANPADPAVLVPKRFGFGYTFNFARAGAWVLMAGTAAYVSGLVVVVPLLTGRR